MLNRIGSGSSQEAIFFWRSLLLLSKNTLRVGWILCSNLANSLRVRRQQCSISQNLGILSSSVGNGILRERFQNLRPVTL